MGYLRVKNWTEFQHYKDRNPPWIKLHRTLLDDYEFACLQDASKLHLMLIWLLASQSDGRIPSDPKFLQGKLGLKSAPDLQPLISHGFLIPEQDASNALAPDAIKLRLETEAYKPTDKAAKKTFIPDGWKPKPETVAPLASEFGFTNGDAERYTAAFVDACKAKGYQYQDFDAAFRNCVRKDWPGFRNGAKTMPKQAESNRPSW